MASPYLAAAGPSRAPAVVIHPDDPLPKTWRVVSIWQYRGQSGAWLAYNSGIPGCFRRAADPTLCHVVYRSTARHAANTSRMGSWLSYGARALVCSVGWELRYSQHINYLPPHGRRAQEEADIEARVTALGRSRADVRAADQAVAAGVFGDDRREVAKAEPKVVSDRLADDYDWTDIAWAPPSMPSPKDIAAQISRAASHADEEPDLRDLDMVTLRRRLAVASFRYWRRQGGTAR